MKTPENPEWFKLIDADQIDTPALLIYSERVSYNIAQLTGMIDDIDRLRPHMKTNKSKEAADLLIEAGITKFKCATIAEAETLALSKAEDVLLAYQPTPVKQQRLLELIKAYPGTLFSCLIDNLDTARQLATLGQENNLDFKAYIDVNLGMNRTGISPGMPTISLFTQSQQLKGLEVLGLHVYDGHIREPDFAERTKVCNRAFREIEETRSLISTAGYEVKIIAGGSPTFPIHALRADIECSPGTFIYWDKGYFDLCQEQPFIPAALVMTRVISQPAENILCLDLGHKSIAPENPLERRVHFLNASVTKFLGQSEEHLVVEVEDGHSWRVGDIWYGLPIHICPTVALYDRAHEVRQGAFKSHWLNIARDRAINI